VPIYSGAGFAGGIPSNSMRRERDMEKRICFAEKKTPSKGSGEPRERLAATCHNATGWERRDRLPMPHFRDKARPDISALVFRSAY
jgi:hypothetical protein